MAHFSGLQSCGSVWSCPSCAAKIRQGRADELETGIANHLAAGGGVEFVTLTVPHGERDDLQGTFDLVADGWRIGVVAGRAWAGCAEGCTVEHRDGDCLGDRRRFGIDAWCRTVEVTLGRNGWHPHIHALLFTAKPWTPRQRALRGAVLFGRWAAFVERRQVEAWGFAAALATLAGHRVDGPAPVRRCARDAFKIVGGALGAGAYVTKVQESESWRLGMEFTRGDLKTGRVQSLTPFELIAPSAAGEKWAMERWWEWEQVTQGRRCMSWSRGARAVLGLDGEEATDDELAAADVGGDEVLDVPGGVWARVVRVAGAESGLLTAVEQGGGPEAGEYLAWVLRPAPPP